MIEAEIDCEFIDVEYDKLGVGRAGLPLLVGILNSFGIVMSIRGL